MTDHANCVPMDQHNDWLRRLREVEADRAILLRDVTDLRARLAEVEAERDRWQRTAANWSGSFLAQAEKLTAAEARLAAVGARLEMFKRAGSMDPITVDGLLAIARGDAQDRAAEGSET